MNQMHEMNQMEWNAWDESIWKLPSSLPQQIRKQYRIENAQKIPGFQTELPRGEFSMLTVRVRKAHKAHMLGAFRRWWCAQTTWVQLENTQQTKLISPTQVYMIDWEMYPLCRLCIYSQFINLWPFLDLSWAAAKNQLRLTRILQLLKRNVVFSEYIRHRLCIHATISNEDSMGY